MVLISCFLKGEEQKKLTPTDGKLNSVTGTFSIVEVKSLNQSCSHFHFSLVTRRTFCVHSGFELELFLSRYAGDAGLLLKLMYTVSGKHICYVV